MTKHFAKRFVDHGGISLASQRIAKLPLHHAKRRLDIGRRMVVLQELLFAEHEVMEHLLKSSASFSGSRTLERDKRSTARFGHGVRVRQTAVSLVCRDLGDCEVLGGSFDHRRKRQGIVCVHLLNVDSGHDVCFDAAHKMALHPILLHPLFAVLHVKPAREAGRCEAGGIDREVRFDAAKRETAFLDKAPQYGRHGGAFQIVKNGVVVRCGGDKALACASRRSLIKRRPLTVE